MKNLAGWDGDRKAMQSGLHPKAQALAILRLIDGEWELRTFGFDCMLFTLAAGRKGQICPTLAVDPVVRDLMLSNAVIEVEHGDDLITYYQITDQGRAVLAEQKEQA